MSETRTYLLLGGAAILGLAVAFGLGGVFPGPAQTETSAPAAEGLRFGDPQPVVMRRWILPENREDAGDYALILTRHATGAGPVIVTDPQTHGAQAHVDHRHMTGGQSAMAVAVTLGMAAQNWKDFAILLQDGQVIDTLTCWQCDVASPDFQGANISDLIAAGRPAAQRHATFHSQAEFDAALAGAEENPDIWIDRTRQFGRSGNTDAPFWVLNTWESLHQ